MNSVGEGSLQLVRRVSLDLLERPRSCRQLQNIRLSSDAAIHLRPRLHYGSKSFARNICKALQQPWLSPQERQEAEVRQRAEEERRRQEKLQEEVRQRAEEGRVFPLRHDTFEPHLAGVGEDGRPVALVNGAC
jgi:gas vesicle protein